MERKYLISDEIYSNSLVQEAIRDFSHITEIVYADSYLSISADSESEIDLLFREFMNYIISL